MHAYVHVLKTLFDKLNRRYYIFKNSYKSYKGNFYHVCLQIVYNLTLFLILCLFLSIQSL